MVATGTVPLQSWGGGFNFSIWHVQLWGTTEEEEVGDAVATLTQVRCARDERCADFTDGFSLERGKLFGSASSI